MGKILVFYTIFVYFMILADIIMIAIISSDNLLPQNSKKQFKYIFLLLGLVTMLEAIFINMSSITYDFIKFKSFIQDFILALSFILGPITGYYLKNIYKKTKFSKVLFYMIIINTFFQIFIMFSDIYYIRSKGFLYENNLFWIYYIMYNIFIYSMLHSIYLLSKEFQVKSMLTLFLMVILFSMGNFIQIINEDYTVIVVCITIIYIFSYLYYTSIINRIDTLTLFFNRTCYENKIKNLNKDCVIIFFDVNKFKYVNDTYGHNCGDIVLQKICELIKKNYINYDSNFYRTGGDEFCVVLESGLKLVDELNKNLKNCIIEEQKIEPRLPGVSIGYGYYFKNASDIKEVIGIADEMMYKNKKEGL